MKPRHVALPESYLPSLGRLLDELGYDLADSRKLASAVLQLSDFYLANPSAATPWDENWARAASLAYYFPLNYARSSAVAREAARLGFMNGLTAIHDFGSGMGAAIHAWADRFSTIDLEATDVSRSALELAASLSPSQRKLVHNSHAPVGSTLLLASYVFTELQIWPDLWNEYEAIAIIEPSTRQDARRLMAEREPLLARGYRFWGPCTHEQPCPLFVHSEKDWCHDRVHFDAPDWFARMEQHLPMKNRTLTFSYLLARKSGPGPALATHARLVGDTLEEKGKTRQALCRNSDREFLAWFPQRFAKGESLEIERGALVDFVAEPEKKSNEVRVKSPDDLHVLAADEFPLRPGTQA